MSLQQGLQHKISLLMFFSSLGRCEDLMFVYASYHAEMATSGLNFSISGSSSHIISVALSRSPLNLLRQTFLTCNILENICSSLALEKGAMRSVLKIRRTFLHSSIIFSLEKTCAQISKYFTLVNYFE